MSSAPVLVTKLDAARRQLETSLRLYFTDGDVVSIHTLAAAAGQILEDLNKKHGGPEMFLRDTFVARFRPEHQRQIRNTLAAPENFLKHADRDPSETLTLRPGHTELLLMEATYAYQNLTQELPPLFGAFRAWFFLVPGASLVMPAEFERMRAWSRDAFDLRSRGAFLAQAMQSLPLSGL